ncbi:HAD family hydrolase [Modestobacter sp. DSM 44400]|uniref:HAD family hydrolase n=1 Tax=Modestobacter sp. DSM 44400 TaxID=1550230 RepID=UPI0020C87925|nr:HAD family hydrolase [Modestobacter sp. DSM 44400]
MLARMLERPVGTADVVAYHEEPGRASVPEAVRPYPGIRAALAALRPHVALAVCTGASTRAAELLLDAADLVDFFSIIVGGDQIERSSRIPRASSGPAESWASPPPGVPTSETRPPTCSRPRAAAHTR